MSVPRSSATTDSPTASQSTTPMIDEYIPETPSDIMSLSSTQCDNETSLPLCDQDTCDNSCEPSTQRRSYQCQVDFTPDYLVAKTSKELELMFKKYPDLKKFVSNNIGREDLYEEICCNAPHDNQVKQIVLQHALKYSVQSALHISCMFGGPRKTTVYKYMASSTVPCWLSSYLVEVNLKQFLEIVKKQSATRTRHGGSKVHAFICVDGTGLNSRMSCKKVPELNNVISVICAKTGLFEPLFIDPEHVAGKSLISLVDSTIPGNFRLVIEAGVRPTAAKCPKCRDSGIWHFLAVFGIFWRHLAFFGGI